MSAATELAVASRARFEYRALRANGALEIGALDAVSVDEVRALLTARGLFAMEVSRPDSSTGTKTRLSSEHLAGGLRLLSSLLGAGLPIDRALTVLLQIAPTGWSVALLEGIRARAREGERLSETLHTSIPDLPPFVRGLIAAGDANGALADGLARAAEELEAANAARAALRAALAYPTLLAVAGTVAVGILVGIVLPRFALLISELGQALPWSTRFVLQSASIVRLSVLPSIIAAVVVAIGAQRWLAGTPGARARRHGCSRSRSPAEFG